MLCTGAGNKCCAHVPGHFMVQCAALSVSGQSLICTFRSESDQRDRARLQLRLALIGIPLPDGAAVVGGDDWHHVALLEVPA